MGQTMNLPLGMNGDWCVNRSEEFGA